MQYIIFTEVIGYFLGHTHDLTQTKIPPILKFLSVRPLLKGKGLPTLPQNFRPITNLALYKKS